MLEKLVRKNILNLKPYRSARDSFTEGILLDANENSYGSVLNPGSKLQLNRYPDPLQTDVREKLSAVLGVEKEKLFIGVGSDEIIDLLIRIFCDPGKDSVLITQPTYGMYKVACDINNVKVLTVPLKKNFQLNVEQILDKVTQNTKIIFLCSPNNPTGNLLNKEDVLNLLDEFNGIVIIDEAYIDFSINGSFISEINNFKNLVIIRTFSKAWGLAGIRAGYSIADEFITDLLFKIKAPYNLNKLTGQAIIEAIEKIETKNKLVKKIIIEREKLIAQLKRIKHISKVIPSQTNFVLFRVENATEVYKELVSSGIIIRNRSNLKGLKNYLRVTVGTPEENNKFLTKLKEIL